MSLCNCVVQKQDIMKFISLSIQADRAIEKMHDFFSDSTDSNTLLLQEKINNSDLSVLLVTTDKQTFQKLALNSAQRNTLKSIVDAWRIVNESHLPDAQREMAWRIINELSIDVEYSGRERESTGFLRRFRCSFVSDIRYFILLTGKSIYGIPIYKLAVLCNYLKMEEGYIPVHAAGVVFKNKLFLFLGPSGAGKSTCASFVTDIGGWVVDEDQVLLYRLDSGQYSANAWGYNLQSCFVPLYAIFFLTQDTKNQLIPVNSLHAVCYLLERSTDVLGNVLSEKGLMHIFKNLATVARQIPAYELYFCKSPDFWQLIDEQFLD